MAVRRIMPYHESPDFEATRAFYTRVLGLEEGSFGGGNIGFGSGQAQVVFAPQARSLFCPIWAWTSTPVQPLTRRTLRQYGRGTRSFTVRLTSPGASAASSFVIRTVLSSACWPTSDPNVHLRASMAAMIPPRKLSPRLQAVVEALPAAAGLPRRGDRLGSGGRRPEPSPPD
jgi:catechol 2,3-dioxygenase-like lactoylglutathione lyase family enzyme